MDGTALVTHWGGRSVAPQAPQGAYHGLTSSSHHPQEAQSRNALPECHRQPGATRMAGQNRALAPANVGT